MPKHRPRKPRNEHLNDLLMTKSKRAGGVHKDKRKLSKEKELRKTLKELE